MPAAKPRKNGSIPEASQLRIHPGKPGPTEIQKVLPLDWYEVTNEPQDELTADPETISLLGSPQEATAMELPVGEANTVIHCLWEKGQHRHSGRCISIPAPDGYEACILIVPTGSCPLILPPLGTD